MDTKRLIAGMSLAMLVMVGWVFLLQYLDKAYPEWDVTGQRARQAATQPGATQPTTGLVDPIATGTAPATGGPVTPLSPATTGQASVTSAGGLRVLPAPDAPAAAVTLGSGTKDDPTYAMAVRLAPAGGGVDAVTLNQFWQTVARQSLYTFQQPYENVEPQTRVLATRWVSVDGQRVDLDSVPWTLVQENASVARASVTIGDPAGAPLVRVTKTYRLTDLPGNKDKARGYELGVDLAFENLAGRPVQVATAINGPTSPPPELDRTPDRQVMVGYNADPAGGYVTIGHDFTDAYSGDKRTRDLTSQDGNPFVWAGMSSAYFNAVLRPVPLADGQRVADYVAEVSATSHDQDASHTNRKVSFEVETKPLVVQAGQSLSLPMQAFFLPKQRDLLNGGYLAAFPYQFDQTLVLTSGICGICTFQWLINLLVMLLNAFHFVLRDWGLAIIALVLVVRALLHPITKKSQVNMFKMQKFAPEIERLKKKYADDKEGLNQAMMQFYKEQGPSQVLGCLPMFLQMPIWIALYSSLQSTFEMRQSPFLRFGDVHLTWIKDLAHPDRLFTFPSVTLPFGFTLEAVNILPVLMGVVFYLQMKLQPKPATMTPEQEQQQKIMMWMMPFIFPLIMYNGPAGLNLYILTSTTLGIIENKIIRRHIKEQEEREKGMGPVIVDAAPKRRRGGGDSGGGPAVRRPDGGPKTGFGGWLARLQDKAEELQREADKRKRKS